MISSVSVALVPAQAYMPRGQTEKAAHQCDAAALLNLVNFCDCFHSVDLKCVREVKLPTMCAGWKVEALPVNQPPPWVIVLAGDPLQKRADALTGAQRQ